MTALRGLVGFTGFVGSNLVRQNRFDRLYNSSNIESISGETFEYLVCAGLPAAKWIANANPKSDRSNMLRLLNALSHCCVDTFVLISTVDVYPNPENATEDTPISLEGHHAYGTTRLELEHELAKVFKRLFILRLPALFGEGLRKNVIFDLLHNNQVEKIHSEAVYQFYWMGHLSDDIFRTINAEIPILNVASEPLSVADIALEAFGIPFKNKPHEAPARYDFRTKYDGVLGGKGGYLYSKAQTLSEIKAFVDNERAKC